MSNNEAYLDSIVIQLEYLKNRNYINSHSTILDFGCGQGRFVNGLIFTKTKINNYYGVDTNLESIKWCNKWLTTFDKKFNFIHLPAYNARYNTKESSLKKLPFINKFSCIFLNSVFSHMLPHDILFYLKELNQCLENNGIIYLTAFVEYNVICVEENPKHYHGTSKGRLHRVRYEKKYFFNLIESCGFKIETFHHQGINRTKQSVFILKKRLHQL